ncbi:nuclear pore complex protein Nup214-like [Ostrea edulis]|uniref:nuclear pore complex protein Nup214-like n=1 Tax=Ostrea edulis TaxID=37623 RepID=UPI0024AF04F5|nr:nuclear pore complex protein Nup214-like [Ostrea edulis]
MAGNEDPPEREVKDFRFQQLCRIRVFDQPENPIPGVTQFVACSSLYGLTFLGTTNGFKVIKTAELTSVDIRHASERTKLIVTDPPLQASVLVEGVMSHVCLSCDELTLAAVVTLDGIVQIYMYDVHGFATQGQVTEPFQKIRMNNEIMDLAWNPTQPTLIVVCMSDGTVKLLEVTENLKIMATLPAVVAARSVCWSPKGKQLVIGSGNGTLMQFDHELKKKRDWARPSILPEDQQFEVRGVSWISTYMFLASYVSDGSGDQPLVILTSGSKDGAPAFVNFEDPCYGNGEGMASMMHFNYIPQWELVLCTSSTACETAIVAKHFDNKSTFERWTLDDAARAELPLTEDYADTFPVGVAVDFSSQYAIPVGEQSHPPSPMFMLLSTEGVLVTYYMIYSHTEVPAITRPPQALPANPVRKPKLTQGSLQRDAAPLEARPNSQAGQPIASPSVSKGQDSVSKASVFGFPPSGSVGKSLFGAPSPQGLSLTSSTPSSSAATGSVFGQISTATTKVGQSFLATALSAPTTAAATTATKTGFTATSAAPSQFSFNPGQSTNFSFNATVTKASTPASISQDVTSTSNISLSSQSSVASNTGFNFSFSSSNVSSSGPGQTQVASGTPVSSTTTTTAQSQPAFGTSTVSKQSAFMFGSSGSTAAGFGVKPSAVSTTPTFGMSAAPTPSTQSSFGSTATSALQKFGSTSVTTPSNLAPASSAGKPAVGTSILAIPSFETTSAPSVPVFGGKSVPTSVMPSFGDVKSAANAASSPQPQTKTGTGMTPKQTIGAPVQGLSVAGKTQNLNIAKPLSAPAAEKQESSGSKPITVQKMPVADTQKALTGSSTSDSLNDTFSASIAEEIAHFERELQEFRQRAGNLKETVGSKEDMQELRNRTVGVSNFCVDVKTNTKEQSKEISDLKSLCLDSFAMVEDCKMRERFNTDPQYSQLMRNKALDPKSLSTMRNLQQEQQLLDQGLRDVDAILDLEWQEYQNRKKNRQGIQRPTTDGIYQVVKSNRNLIIREKNHLDKLESHLKQLKLYNRNSAWRHPDTSREPAELSSLADSLLESPRKSPEKPRREARSELLDPRKQAKLREYLSRKTVIKVKSTRPENLSMSRLASTEKIRQALSRQNSPTKPRAPADMKAAVKPTIPGRTILRATSHNGARQTANQGLQPGVQPGFRQQINMQAKSNSHPGLMFANSGNTMSSMMGFQQKVPQDLKSSVSYPEFEDITPTTSTDGTEEDEDDDYDEDDDDYDDGMGPDSGHDSEPLNRKIAERKPASIMSTVSSVTTMTTKASTLPVQNFGQPMSGFSSFSGTSKIVFGSGAKPESTPSMGSPKPVFGGGFQGFKADDKTPTHTSTPKTTLKFGSDAAPSFQGKNLFSQPLKAEESKTEESKPVSSPLLAKALSLESDEEDVELGETKISVEKSGQTQPKPASIPTEASKGKAESGGLFGIRKVPSNNSLTDTAAPTAVFGQSSSTTSSLLQPNSGNPVSGPASSSTAGRGLFGMTNSGEVPGGSLLGQTSAAGGGLFGKPTKDEEKEKSTPAATSSTGLFGQNTTLSSTGSFGQPSSLQTSLTSTSGVLSQVTTLAVTTISESPSTGQESAAPAITTVAGGLFGQQKATTVTSSSGSELSGPQPANSENGLFGQPSTTVSRLIGQQTTTTYGLFGKTSTSPPPYPNAESGLIGRPTTSGSGAFVQSSATSSTGTGLFGKPTTITSSTGTGLFGKPTTTGSELFGQQTTTSVSGAGLFGQQTTTSGTGIFGQQTASVTSLTSSSGDGQFGQQTTTPGAGLFGQQTTSTTSSTSGSNIFGQSNTTPHSGDGLFGASAASTTSSAGTGLFGQTSATSNAGTGLFGQSGTGGFSQSSDSKPSMIGGLLSATDEAPAISATFGQVDPAKNLFGSQPGTSSSASLFGQPPPPFGSSASSSAGPGFGSTSTSGGFSSSGGGLGFGSTVTTTAMSGFGQANQGMFGQSTSSIGSSPFGGFGNTPSAQSSGGMFGGGGGGMFSGLGGKPSEDKANTNVFGTATFGSPGAPESNLFGNQGSNTFRSAGGSSPFTGGGFSGGGSNVASSGFSVAKPQSPGGFGGTPSFGASPAFGGQASFGSSPGFGSAPSFGGGTTFGNGASFPSQIGSPQNTGNAGGFAGFASSASPTFGGLAQTGGTPTFGGMSQGDSGFGGFGGGGGGGGGGFGASPSFGQPSNPGGNPSFTGYRS